MDRYTWIIHAYVYDIYTWPCGSIWYLPYKCTYTSRSIHLSATYIGPWPYLWEVDQHMSKHTDMLCIYTICLFSAYIFWCILVFAPYVQMYIQLSYAQTWFFDIDTKISIPPRMYIYMKHTRICSWDLHETYKDMYMISLLDLLWPYLPFSWRCYSL